MRDLLLFLLKRLSRPFWGKGIYWRFPLISKIYGYLYRFLSPDGIILISINGLKIYAEGKSNMARFLGVKGFYEEETTKLFTEIVREGMTVIDLGANIGYYSLLAGRLVGDRGKVFAFEPFTQSFSLLQKNIEANGFKNIIPVAKAVSDQSGKQKLFLAEDSGEHSLGVDDSCNYVEVDVTTVDEFASEQNISVDLVKMDVEGAEMSVLDGMAETINKNPHMKIITEFVREHLKRNNCSPEAFLDRLRGYGYKLYAVNDDKHTRLLITPDNVNDLMFANIYCDRDGE